jgi:hypothetical protein
MPWRLRATSGGSSPAFGPRVKRKRRLEAVLLTVDGAIELLDLTVGQHDALTSALACARAAGWVLRVIVLLRQE